MAALTNNYQKCELLNLGYGPKKRGPFIIRQEGSVPGSMTMQQERFLLRRDGTWVLNLAVFALPEEKKEEFLHASMKEVISLLDGLTGQPVVEDKLPEGTSFEELRSSAESTLTGIWGRIQSARASSLPH